MLVEITNTLTNCQCGKQLIIVYITKSKSRVFFLSQFSLQFNSELNIPM